MYIQNNTILYTHYTAEAAHRLPLHDGLCKYLHGHSYKFKIGVKVKENSVLPKWSTTEGEMPFLCFSKLKQELKAYFDNYDHAILVGNKDTDLLRFVQGLSNDNRFKLFDGETTVENFLQHVVLELNHTIKNDCFDVVFVEIHETATNSAVWSIV